MPISKNDKRLSKGKRAVPDVFPESNNSRVKDFILHPELIAVEQLEELKQIRILLEKLLKKS